MPVNYSYINYLIEIKIKNILKSILKLKNFLVNFIINSNLKKK